MIHRVKEQAAPGREIGRKAQAEKGQRALDDDGAGDAQCGSDHDRAQRVGQDMTQDHVQRRRTNGAGGQHELALFQGQHFAAHDARGLHPGSGADGDHHQDEDAGLRPQPG